MFRSDVLPAPLGPMIEAIAPRLTVIDTSSTARTPPNRFDTAVAASKISSEAPADAWVPPTAMLSASSQKRHGGSCAAVMAGMMRTQSRECNRVRFRTRAIGPLPSPTQLLSLADDKPSV